MSVLIRPGVPSDHALLHDAFWHHATARAPLGVPAMRRVPHRILAMKLDALLRAPDWRLTCAVPDHEPDEILGLLLSGPMAPVQTLGWLHVKPMWRGHGVASSLLKAAGVHPGEIDCAFLDPVAAKRASLRGYTLRWRPYLPDVALWDAAKRESATAA